MLLFTQNTEIVEESRRGVHPVVDIKGGKRKKSKSEIMMMMINYFN
jgi:hypothetical protein